MKQKDAREMKKNSKQKSNPNKPLRGQEKIAHYNAILIEELTSKFNFVIDRVMALDEKFTKLLNDHIEENLQSFADVKFIFKKIFEKFDEVRSQWEINNQHWDEHNKLRWEKNRFEHQQMMQELKVLAVRPDEHDVTLKKICA